MFLKKKKKKTWFNSCNSVYFVPILGFDSEYIREWNKIIINE